MGTVCDFLSTMKVLFTVVLIVLLSYDANGCRASSEAPQSVPQQKKPTMRKLKIGSRNGVDFREPFSGTRFTDFDWRLTKEVLAREPSNALISPLSVKIALILLYEAAGFGSLQSQTAKELQIILHNDLGISNYRQFYHDILQSFTKQNSPLNIGTCLFINEDVEPVSRFVEVIKSNYYADVTNLPLKKTKAAVEAINKWASLATNGNIKSLMDEKSIQNAFMILVNAIYFQGSWQYPFPEEVIIGEFYPSDKRRQSVVNVEYMKQFNSFFYGNSKEFNVEFVRLPYTERLSMFVLLPNANSFIQNVLENIYSNPAGFNEALNQMDIVDMNVTLPVFKFDITTNLNEALQSLGIVTIFSNEANFPFLTKNRNLDLRVSNVRQKIGITVTRNGTEAYVATDVALVDKFGGPPKNFEVNRPFLFFIEDDVTGVLIFAGKVENPC